MIKYSYELNLGIKNKLHSIIANEASREIINDVYSNMMKYTHREIYSNIQNFIIELYRK